MSGGFFIGESHMSRAAELGKKIGELDAEKKTIKKKLDD